jgi:ketol-acid reductoisomerase
MLTLPDVSMAKIYDAEIRTKLHSGHTLLFTHGYGIHFGGILPPPDVDVALVAPKGPGAGLRSESLNGSGLPCLIAVYQNISGNAKKTALAYAQAIGCSKRGIFETTFEEECVTDLFGEQTVLCGGLSELVKAGFETLVKAGYQPELAYFECLHETRLVVDLLVKRGIAGMLEEISDTAEYGAVTAGTQIVTPQTRKAMEQILEHIRSGTFAKRMTSAAIDGLASSRQQLRATEIEMVGERVRKIIGILE